MRSKFLIALTAVVGLGLCAVSDAQTAAKPDVALFFKQAKIQSVQLSPSGKYLAMTILGKTNRYHLGIVETANPGKVNMIITDDAMGVYDATWLNDERLYFRTGEPTDLSDVRNGEYYAINRDGTYRTKLMSNHDEGNNTGKGAPLWARNYSIYGTLDDGTDDLLVAYDTVSEKERALTSERLFRLNTRSLALKEILTDLQPKNVTGWLLDKEHEPRFAFASDGGETVVHYRAPGNKEWVEISRFKFLDPAVISPAFIDGSGQTYVYKGDTHGFQSLYKFDIATRKAEAEPLLEVKGFDVTASPVFERKTKRLLGFHYESDAENTVWLDEPMKAIQAKIDAQMPGTINFLSCRGGGAAHVCVIFSDSDQDPGRYWLYKSASDELAAIGAVRPDIDPAKMARVDFHHYKARDGLEIPVYVTTPAGKATGPRPAVVMVHGGPTARGGHWDWNRNNQFLASRGYVVIEPDFRGSIGYGRKLFKAGWKKWGLEMQDDITDAANWAVAKGWVDKNRIAIAGASYGGYATLMGLIKTPEVFRCGINWVGVTDLDLLYTVSWSDASKASVEYGDKLLIGDPETDAARFKATSPLAQHEGLNKPLLMAYGTSDVRVPLVHGTKFRDAVMKHNPNVEWVAYDKEGHGWRLEKNNVDWWTRVENFLEKNMQPLP